MLFCDLSVIHGLAERTLEALGMLENVLEKPYALGIIVAVCKALVYGETEIDAVAVFILAVFVAIYRTYGYAYLRWPGVEVTDETGKLPPYVSAVLSFVAHRIGSPVKGSRQLAAEGLN